MSNGKKGISFDEIEDRALMSKPNQAIFVNTLDINLDTLGSSMSTKK